MPRTVEYAGRRFIVWEAPPQHVPRPFGHIGEHVAVPAPGWYWREHGESEQHEVETEAQAYLMIGGYCAAQRMKGGVCSPS